MPAPGAVKCALALFSRDHRPKLSSCKGRWPLPLCVAFVVRHLTRAGSLAEGPRRLAGPEGPPHVAGHWLLPMGRLLQGPRPTLGGFVTCLGSPLPAPPWERGGQGCWRPRGSAYHRAWQRSLRRAVTRCCLTARPLGGPCSRKEQAGWRGEEVAVTGRAGRHSLQDGAAPRDSGSAGRSGRGSGTKHGRPAGQQ